MTQHIVDKEKTVLPPMSRSPPRRYPKTNSKSDVCVKIIHMQHVNTR